MSEFEFYNLLDKRLRIILEKSHSDNQLHWYYNLTKL